jgi:5-methylcytosine-specific restriction endonuclease McrA
MTGKHGNHWRPPVKQRVSVACEVCGVVREYLPSQVRRFCSQACNGKSRDTRVVVPCRQCGIPTQKRPWFLERNSAAYCSPACQRLGKRREDAKWRDPKQIAAYMRRYARNNREQHNARGRAWGKAHRDKKNQAQRARRAAGDPHAFTEQDWLEMKRRCGFRCLACKRTESLLVVLQPDHVVPVARGGEHSVANIQPLCGRCNRAKGAKTTDYRQSEVA